MSLFSPTAPWQQAAARVQVFKVYGEGLDALSDADLTTLLADLKRRNIALGLEWPVLTSSICGNGIEGFGGSFLRHAQRIKALGGTLTYLAMQQPFQWGSLYKGANSCQWTAQQVAVNALLPINEAKTVFPNLLVGDIMAVPPFRDSSDWPAQFGVWFDTWKSLAGAPMAFFHVDADWTVPNWQAAVTAIRPVAAQRGIPFGMVYNGFLTNESDVAWMGAAEDHFIDYEIRNGNPPPDQVNFQSWNPHPTHVLPETDPTAFTYLIDRYFRTRTQVTLARAGTNLNGKLSTGGTGIPGASIQVTAQPMSGSSAITTYTITGTVPSAARTAIVGARINSECYSCNGNTDLSVYAFQYNETPPATASKTWDFNSGLLGWLYGPGLEAYDPGPAPYTQGLRITAQPGQAKGLNSNAIAVTAGAQFTLKVTARVSPLSVGSGYFTLIWFDVNGNEPSREIIMFQPQTITVGSPATAADGSFSIGTALDPNIYQFTAAYGGSSTQWPSMAKLPGSGTNFPPSIVSLTPFVGSGTSATFTAVVSDPNGWGDIANAEVLINTDRFPQSGCYIRYLPASGTFQLLDDAGSTWSSVALSNSQCSLGSASAVGLANSLTLTLPVTFQTSFGSPVAKKSIFVQATDSKGLVASWLAMGVWYPGGQVGTPTAWYRLFDPFSHAHHFTTDLNEYTTLGLRGYTLEGSISQILGAPGSSGSVTAVPWWRIAVVASQSHFWTGDRNEYTTLIQNRAAYVGEGADGFVFLTPPAGAIPLMRLSYDPSAGAIHHWTTDQNEYTVLGGQGWSREGVASYMFPPPPAVSAPVGAAVTSAASYRTGPVSSGEVLAVFGSGPVSFDGVEVETTAVSDLERRVVVPRRLGRVTRVRIGDEEIALPVAEASPAIFASDASGRGKAAGEGTAKRGSVITLYATGLGTAPLSATIGAYPAEIVSAEPSGVRLGVVVVRVRVPQDMPSGESVPVRLRAGEAYSQSGVTIAVE